MKYRLGFVMAGVVLLLLALFGLLALWLPVAALAGIGVFLGVLVLIYVSTRRVRGQWFRSNGVRIHFTDEGSGEPLILIHGLGVNGDINWRWPGVTRHLRKTCRVITIDLRGHGLSDHPHNASSNGTELVEDVVRLMDHLAIAKTHVVGYSLGGFITLKLLTMYPDRLRTAVVGGAGWYELTTPKMSILTALADSLEHNGTFDPLVRALEPAKDPSAAKVWLIDAAMAWLNDMQAMQALVTSMPDLHVTEEALRANRVPALVIVGGSDPLKDAVENLDGVMTSARVVYLPEKDHATAMLCGRFKNEIQMQLHAT